MHCLRSMLVSSTYIVSAHPRHPSRPPTAIALGARAINGTTSYGLACAGATVLINGLPRDTFRYPCRNLTPAEFRWSDSDRLTAAPLLPGCDHITKTGMRWLRDLISPALSIYIELIGMRACIYACS